MSLVKLGGVILVGAAAAFPAATVSEQAAEANGGVNISGAYSIKGQGGGTTYTGSATISKIGGSMYKGKWTIGDNTFLGVGFQDDDDFSCGWSLKDKDANVVAYLVKEDGLDGVWFEEGDNAVGLEYLKPSGAMKKNLNGTYTIGHIEKDGSFVKTGMTPPRDDAPAKPYKGTVVVKQRSDVGDGIYQFTWKWPDGGTEDGIGVRNVDSGQDDVLSVGFSDKGDEFGALQYNVQKGGKVLDGTWVQDIKGKVSAGTEKLTKL